MFDRLKQTKIGRIGLVAAAVWPIVDTSFPAIGAEWFVIPGGQEIAQAEDEDGFDLRCRMDEKGVTLTERGRSEFFPYNRLSVSVQQARLDSRRSDAEKLQTPLTITVTTCAPSRVESNFCIAYFGRHTPGEVPEPTWHLVDRMLDSLEARGACIARGRPCEDCVQSDIDDAVSCEDQHRPMSNRPDPSVRMLSASGSTNKR